MSQSTETTHQPQLTAISGADGVDGAVRAARRVVAALLHAGGNSAAEMSDVTDRLNAVADDLEGHAATLDDRMVEMWAGDEFTRHDPVAGPENAIAPPLPLHGMPDGSVRGETTLGLAYQGPPGYVHGGVTALLLDHTLGVANHWAAGPTGMTAELTLRYHRPTPLFTPLTVTGKQVSVDGRTIHATGEISANGKCCVRAQGVFVAKHPPRPR